MRRLWYVMWKELLELRSDPRLFGVIFIAPVVQLTMLGYAASTDVKDVPIVIVDQDRSARSRELIARFEGSPYFRVVGTAGNLNEIDPWLERSEAWMALAIPGDYRDQLGNGRPATVQVVADGTDSNSTNVALGYASNLLAAYNQELAERRAASEGRTLLARCTQPIGVQGASAGSPAQRRPAFTGLNPSTSFDGSMAAMTFCGSICFGSGSCTRMPWTAGSALKRATNARRSVSLVVSGSR